MKKLLLLLFSGICCICSVCGQTKYEQLFDSACAYLEKKQVTEGESILLDLERNEEAPERVRLNATLVLANFYVNQEMINKSQPKLLKLLTYRNAHPDDLDLHNAYVGLWNHYVNQKWSEVPVTQRFYGTWVSTEVDNSGAPVLVVSISEDRGNVEAKINDRCLFRSFYSNDLRTSDISIQDYGKNGNCDLFFGEERLKGGAKGLSEFIAKYSYQTGKSMNDAIATQNRSKPLSAENIVGQTVTNIGTRLGQGIAEELSVTKNHYYTCRIHLFEKIPGIVEARLYYTHIVSRSDGPVYDSEVYERKISLYKIDRKDNVVFVGKDGILMGFSEIKYGHISAPSDEDLSVEQRTYLNNPHQFNEYAYKRLYTVVQKRIDNMLDRPNHFVENDFKYAPKGFGYTDMLTICLPKTFKYEPALYFRGAYKKTEVKRMQDFFDTPEVAEAKYHELKYSDEQYKYRKGITQKFILVEGKLTNSAYGNDSIYVGSFKDNKLHGKGWLKEWDDKLRTNIVYIGNFNNDKKDGEGVAYYGDGKVMKQFWKRGKLVKERRME